MLRLTDSQPGVLNSAGEKPVEQPSGRRVPVDFSILQASLAALFPKLAHSERVIGQ
jgi:hypothetical protein